MIMHDELKHILFESLQHGNNNYNNSSLLLNMSRFGMRATIVWSGSGVLALGCLLRCVSLDSQVFRLMVIMIMMFDQGFDDGGDGDVEDVFSDVSRLILRCGDNKMMVVVIII